MKITDTIARPRPHAGITMHQLPVGANFPGLVFAVGSVLIFVLGVPAFAWVLGMAALMGIGVAALLRFVRG